MNYAHSLLVILHHQLKDNSKFNMNFNLNMKYDDLPLQIHLSTLLPTTFMSFDITFIFTASGNFLKNGKKRVIICITNMCFLRFAMQITSPHRGQQGLCT